MIPLWEDGKCETRVILDLPSLTFLVALGMFWDSLVSQYLLVEFYSILFWRNLECVHETVESCWIPTSFWIAPWQFFVAGEQSRFWVSHFAKPFPKSPKNWWILAPFVAPQNKADGGDHLGSPQSSWLRTENLIYPVKNAVNCWY